MKNALLWGLIIGVLSGLWLYAMHIMGYDTVSDKVSPYEYLSVLIPLGGLYFGIRDYRNNELDGKMGFLEALIQSFKILLVGGIIAVFSAIVYINYVGAENNFRDFSGRMFGALLVGILFALSISLLLTTKSNKVD